MIEAAYAVAVVNNGGKLTSEWRDEVEPLRPVIRQLAALLSTGQAVTHQTVQGLIDAELWGSEHPS
jgi:hypothetical protein